MASLLSLSDDALLAVLESLSLIERHSVLALVCRRFRRLVNGSARLHATVDLCIGPERSKWPDDKKEEQRVWQQQLARIDSLVAWLAHHAAGSVRQLRLAAPGPFYQPASEAKQVATAVEALVLQTSRPARGISSGLTALALADQAAFCPVAPPTVAALSSLQRLMLMSKEQLEWCLPAVALPQLQQLVLMGQPLVVPPAAHFPPSLTCLRLGSGYGPVGGVAVPPQVQQLTGLHTLGLYEVELDTDAVLPASLRQLELSDVGYTHLNLTRLTTLESLMVKEMVDDDLLVQAASMRSLHALAWLWSYDSLQLPAGPLIGQLERLVINTKSVANNTAALAAATRLHTLGINFDGLYDHDRHGPGIWLDALHLPPLLPALRTLALGGTDACLSTVVQAIVGLQRRLPHLEISCHFGDSAEWDAEWCLLARCGFQAPWLEASFKDFIV